MNISCRVISYIDRLGVITERVKLVIHHALLEVFFMSYQMK